MHLCDGDESHRKVEGACFSVLRPWVASVGQGPDQHESVAVGSELVVQRHDQRSADPPSTISSMDRQPRDLRGLRIWASDGQEAAHLAVDLRDEPRLGSHCFRALPDTLL